MLLDMLHEDIAYIPGYAHIRGNDRKETLDTFGYLTIYIDMGTVGCRNIDQIPFPIATRFPLSFSGALQQPFSLKGLRQVL